MTGDPRHSFTCSCVDIRDLRRNRVCVRLNCLATFRACLLSTQLTLRLQDEAETRTSTDAGVYGDPDGVSFMNVCKRGMKPNGVYVGSDPSMLRIITLFGSFGNSPSLLVRYLQETANATNFGHQ
ncbi:uncharacterized protein LOC110920445 isoform X2 [Helianthus annuus]|uniref:uncharacterized protein LOC110920445 isoform X2 n=1 Tax=Helianthus annuus TaxID=4232 RepID=UPI001652C1A1|nr:uncharacterized protein LOC110920445 isoform X2 [Helianthus annuus]